MSKSPTADRLRRAIAKAVPADEPRFSGYFHRDEPAAWSKDELVVVADGAGAGHRARANVIARLLDVPLTISSALGPRTKLAIVDTFPLGARHGLDRAALLAVPMRVLVTRYVKPGTYEGYDDLLSMYHARIAPYPFGACEWQHCDGDVEHVGHLVRPIAIDPGRATTLVVGIGDRALVPASIARGFSLPMPFVEGPFDVLPPALGYLCAGAGYNLVYELAAIRARAAHVPFERRYDNQFLRAERLGIGVYSASDLARFVEAV